MSKFFICTFGCRCNQADSAAIRESLLCRSMSESRTHLDADLIVINSCTVTHRTDKQVRQAIRRFGRENPAARMIVTGCYAQRDPENLAAMAGVGCVLGNTEKDRLAEYIAEDSDCRLQGKIFCSPLDENCDPLPMPATRFGGKTRPLIKLQDGCDARCAYCIVPHVRGTGRSACPEDVIAEVQLLVGQGFQEIVLAGVNLGAFGRKIKGHAHLIDLLRQIVRFPGLGRIRLSSIEPMSFNRDIARLAAQNPVLAHHFHIPLQSGSDRILRLMRRPYKADRFLKLLRYIQSELPDVGLGTDVLVGFPGETEQDFRETCDLIESAPLTYLHVFPFSPREGTEAYSFPERIPSQVMKRRLGLALEISAAKNLAFRRRFLGQLLPAITLAKEEALGSSAVLTGNYIHARVSGLTVPANRLVEIRIEDVRTDTTYASIHR
jgi:threonylcarbamoyladenosine tRNA methylthiotransferase MtaB